MTPRRTALLLVLRSASLLGLFLFPNRSFADVTYTLRIVPGTPAEAALAFKDFGSTVSGDSREVSARGGWTYRIITPPNSRCELRYVATGAPRVDVLGFDLKPIQSRTEAGSTGTVLHCTSPSNQ